MENSINKIESIKTIDVKPINNIKSKTEIKNIFNKKENHNSQKRIDKIFQSSKLNNKTKEIEKQYKTKKLKETKSCVNKQKNSFFKRKNTYQKNEFNTNFIFNTPLKSNKSKEKEKDNSNFASLINKRKIKMFSSFKNIDNYKNIFTEMSKELSQSNDITYENIRIIKGGEKNKNQLEESNQIHKIKQNSSQMDYNKRLYTPQLSTNYIIKNRNKDTIKEIKNKNYSNRKYTEITKNISYNKSFHSKKKNLFKKKVENFIPRTLITNSSSINKPNNKFKTLNKAEDSNKKNKMIEKEEYYIIINTEQNEQRFTNPITYKKINTPFKVNKSEKNILELSNKNLKDFNKKRPDFHFNKKIIDNRNSLNSFNNRYNKNEQNIQSSINNKNQTSKTHLSMKKTHDKKTKQYIKEYLNPKTRGISNKNLANSKNGTEKNEVVEQKKNSYNFRHKTTKNVSLQGHNVFSEENRDLHNTSYKGFSAFKKLEEIKKKYKFRPQIKEKKAHLIERNSNINYVEESQGLAKLLSSNNLIEKSFNDENNSAKSSQKDEDNNNSDEISDNTSNKENDDILNSKSFILDLNNVIPINEKELINTVSKISLPNSKTEVGNKKEKKIFDFNNSFEINNDEDNNKENRE